MLKEKTEKLVVKEKIKNTMNGIIPIMILKYMIKMGII